MKRSTGKFFVSLLVLGAAQAALAFSLLGPYKGFQQTAIGYNLPGDIGAPMTPSEAYRWNVPTVTYGFDRSFVEYFGSNGMAAVDAAFKILNDLPDYSLITNDASSLYIGGQRIPLDTKQVNFEAQTLGLDDVKSTALVHILEELGLTTPERWVWALRARTIQTINNISITNYSVIKVNYDPITLRPSSYVNGALYSYTILEFLAPLAYADAVETPVDPVAFNYSSVVGGLDNGGFNFSFNSGFTTIGLGSGEFYSGLTQDDIAALRYLYNANNLATELLLPSITGGNAAGVGSSPWTPVLNITNFATGGTNLVTTTGTNLIVQGLRPGVNKLHFQRVNFDSLLGQLFVPITNQYSDTIISNAQTFVQPVSRAITQPDILFVAQDLGLLGDNLTPVPTARTSTAGWQNNDPINGSTTQGGPGVITPQVQIFFTDQYPFLINRNPGRVDESTAFFTSAIWGSFDGTTNAPVIYPAYGTLTLDDLRSFVLQGGGN